MHGMRGRDSSAQLNRALCTRVPRPSSGKINRFLYLWQLVVPLLCDIRQRNGKTTMIARDDVRQGEREGKYNILFLDDRNGPTARGTTEINYRTLQIAEVA